MYVDPEVLVILPALLGTEAESLVKFLREFEKISRVHKRPEESSEEDLKLRIILVSLKGYEDAWLADWSPTTFDQSSEKSFSTNSSQLQKQENSDRKSERSPKE